ncbi:hypothetical protein, partial [uncultured Ruegeria sp.]|uniref:hypothetical protein n=1 Tax=uncultured Ruegeria sp. TaxID=259304 RepID=UPI002632DAD3
IRQAESTRASGRYEGRDPSRIYGQAMKKPTVLHGSFHQRSQLLDLTTGWRDAFQTQRDAPG